MHHSAPQFERDALQLEIAEALKDGLRGLNDLKLVPHNDPDVLRLKRHLREKIAELEGEELEGEEPEAV
jgi:hypothetical protein